MRSSFLALFAGALSFSADSVISSFFLMIPPGQFLAVWLPANLEHALRQAGG